jgi:hypothetical protein
MAFTNAQGLSQLIAALPNQAASFNSIGDRGS